MTPDLHGSSQGSAVLEAIEIDSNDPPTQWAMIMRGLDALSRCVTEGGFGTVDARLEFLWLPGHPNDKVRRFGLRTASCPTVVWLVMNRMLRARGVCSSTMESRFRSLAAQDSSVPQGTEETVAIMAGAEAIELEWTELPKDDDVEYLHITLSDTADPVQIDALWSLVSDWLELLFGGWPPPGNDALAVTVGHIYRQDPKTVIVRLSGWPVLPSAMRILRNLLGGPKGRSLGVRRLSRD